MADARDPRIPAPARPQHYFSTEPAVASAPLEVELVLPDLKLTLRSDRGVFSPGRIDAGTKLLLLEDPLASRVVGTGDAPPTLVDVGCGYGPIALTLARRHPTANVLAVDVNRRALDLCRTNARALGLRNVVVGEEEELGPIGPVSAVYSNPPIRVGKAALQELLERWAARLAPGAPLLLVVRRDLGAQSLERWLAARSWSPRRLAARAGYRVLEAVPPAGVRVMTEARRSYSSTELKRLHRGWRRQTSGRLALVLDGVQNPFNLGSIARTAAALRVERAWLVGPEVDLRSPKVQKTALGSDRLLRWDACARSDPALTAARDDGYRLVGLELGTGSVPLFDLDLSGDVCLVIGHEERGLSKAALVGCDQVGFVPLLGRIGSLNVATATALALYEARRQEWAASPRDG